MQLNRRSLNRTLGLAIAAIAAVALVGSVLVLGALGQLNTATASRHRSDQIITGLNSFRSAMLDQETGVRGYLLTGRPSSLEPYEAGRPALNAAIDKLQRVIGDNAAQRELLAQAVVAARDWQTNIGEAVVRQNADPATRSRALALESSGAGKTSFDRFRAKLTPIEDQERRSYAGKTTVVELAERQAQIALWSSAILTLLICMGVGIAINRLVARPLIELADAMSRLVQRDMSFTVPSVGRRNEVGTMARAVQVFKDSLIELDRTSLLRVTADTLPALVGYVDAERRIGFFNEEFARWFDLGGKDVSETRGLPLEMVFPEGRVPWIRRAARRGPRRRGERASRSRSLPRARVRTRSRPISGRIARRTAACSASSRSSPTSATARTSTASCAPRRASCSARTRSSSSSPMSPRTTSRRRCAGIENLATWIEEDLAEALTGDTRTNMDLLRNRVRRLESLLDDLLAYSRAGRENLGVREVDTAALVDELAGLISPPPGFSIEAAPGLPTLPAVHAALSQVLQQPHRQRHQASSRRRARPRLGRRASGRARLRVHRRRRRSRHSRAVPRPGVRDVPDPEAARRGRR